MYGAVHTQAHILTHTIYIYITYITHKQKMRSRNNVCNLLVCGLEIATQGQGEAPEEKRPWEQGSI